MSHPSHLLRSLFFRASTTKTQPTVDITTIASVNKLSFLAIKVFQKYDVLETVMRPVDGNCLLHAVLTTVSAKI